ncbi:MAG: LacI family transcriptional regulator [Propionibacteriaceae bacterium]|jgi:DNA-binding LacI/PurR family transcriptional regulator|nr:LacI family transcriptional regulator [Propionibacteriaceae bacterium]
MGGRLIDIARKVGVSEATVSRVLNDKPGVSQEVRDAVLTAVDVLGYERPARLRMERGRLVGLVLPELVNPIFPAFAEVIGGALVQQGFTPVLCTRSAGGVSEAEYVDLLIEQQVSGVIFVGGLCSEEAADHGHYLRLHRLGMPVVLINAAVDTVPFPRVTCDDALAMRCAMKHLSSLGHTRIGLLLGPIDHVPSNLKLAGARAMAAEQGWDWNPELVVHSQYSVEAAQAATVGLLAGGVTAIACASDMMALGAIRAARRAGLRVPEDISVVGYDDSVLMNSTSPALTTLRQPIETMGASAVDLLARAIVSGAEQVRELLFEPALVVRDSTAMIAS